MQSDAKGSFRFASFDALLNDPFASFLLHLLQNRIDEKDFSDIGFLRDVLVRMLAENCRKCRMA